MREVQFVRRNAEKWKRFEALLDEDAVDADELADLYVEINEDLSYAQTFYPDASSTQYLNELASRVHQTIYSTRPEERSRIWTFWTEEVPLALARSRTELLVSALVFVVAIAVGALSAANDSSFVRLILGDAYVNMTLQNIEEGDPMAVYKQAHEVDMFLGIALNNVRVAFYAFAAGIFCTLGTGWVLFQNGVMLGSFHYLFYEHGLLGPSLMVVYIHGTLEIAAIIVAGAAGIRFGRGLLFPGTHSRRTAFTNGAREGAKVVVGLVPVFILAAFLEGFVTRYTAMPAALSLAIIGTSLAAVLGYFVAYPYWLQRRSGARR
jgi:uncharacterized membrane protein SpoIIM required for sporulation